MADSFCLGEIAIIKLDAETYEEVAILHFFMAIPDYYTSEEYVLLFHHPNLLNHLSYFFGRVNKSRGGSYGGYLKCSRIFISSTFAGTPGVLTDKEALEQIEQFVVQETQDTPIIAFAKVCRIDSTHAQPF